MISVEEKEQSLNLVVALGVVSSWDPPHLSFLPLCAGVNIYQLFSSVHLVQLYVHSLVGWE